MGFHNFGYTSYIYLNTKHRSKKDVAFLLFFDEIRVIVHAKYGGTCDRR